MDTVSVRALCSPATELEFPGLSLISYVKPIEKYLSFEPRSGSKCQLYSQGKLNTLRRENRLNINSKSTQTNGFIRWRNLISIE
jgi:hypothetical protein